uniref:Arylsulfatase H n=1 Tax=Cyprinus carpio carpio TaxID=630221 RepID=A0A9J8A9V5_CYPCA
MLIISLALQRNMLLENRSLRFFAGLLVLLQSSSYVTGADHDSRPNFVLMMVDDLGIGDIGCYGNDTISTPNIDGLAADGVRLTQHLAAAPLCTPSRTAFMTGRYALRAGLGSTGRVQVILFLAGSGGLLPNETTFAKLLQKQGYTTGIVGKWHLGVNCESRNDHCHHPNNHGFDFFYGLPFTNFNDCKPGAGKGVLVDVQETLWQISVLLTLASLTLLAARASGLLRVSWTLVAFLAAMSLLSFAAWFVPFELLRTWNCIIMRNGEVVEQPLKLETLNARLMSEAERFVERHKDGPFLLFLSLAHVHTPLFVSEGFTGKSKHGLYGDNVEEVDWMVGRMMETIARLGLSEKTLMYFTSDHGGHIEEGPKGGWNGIYRGGKAMGGWEGGIRVPGIFRWPGRLNPGREVAEPTSLMDVFPTVVKLAGGALPEDRILDGRDLMPLLEGRTNRSQHEFMFHYCGMYLNAVRWHPPDSESIFKVHFFTPNFSPAGAVGCYHTGVCMCHRPFVTYHNPPLVFELSRDPSESRPLSPDTEPRLAEVLERVKRAVTEHRRTLAPVEKQLTWTKVLWKPWLQPCCGTFPFCSCEESNHTSAAAE